MSDMSLSLPENFYTTKMQIKESKKILSFVRQKSVSLFRLNLIPVSSSCGLMFSIVYFQE